MRSSNSNIATSLANRDARVRMRRRVPTPGRTFLQKRVLPPKDIIVVVLDEQGICWDGARPFKPGRDQENPDVPFWTYFLPNPLPSNP